MKKSVLYRIVTWCLVSICLFIPDVGLARYSRQEKKRQLIGSFIERLEQEKNALQGGFIAIFDEGNVIYQTVFGHQKGNEGSSVTEDTLFPVASISKLTSAMALALLVNAGQIDLDKNYKLPYLAHEVTLGQILSHTTGYNFAEGDKLIESGMSREDILAVLAKTTPSGAAGSCHAYSNVIFGLINEILLSEKTSLRSCIDNLRTALDTAGIQLAPLALDADVAYPHRADENGVVVESLPHAPYYPYAAPAAAGIYASCKGLIELFRLRFGYRPDLISASLLDKYNRRMAVARDFKKFNKEWPIPPKYIHSYYGLGCRIVHSMRDPGKDMIFHTGFLNGMGSFIGFIPGEGVGIIVVVNQNSRFTYRTAFDFWGLFLEKYNKIPRHCGRRNFKLSLKQA